MIVYSLYRTSVQEILNFIRNNPSIHPTAFVGHQKKNGEIVKMAEKGQTEPPSTEQLYEGMKPKPQRSIASFFGGSEISFALLQRDKEVRIRPDFQ